MIAFIIDGTAQLYISPQKCIDDDGEGGVSFSTDMVYFDHFL